MLETLSIVYLYVKSLHVMAVISWMAALFYLPRLYVYHAERGEREDEPAVSLTLMEDKLLRLIMRPAMIMTWLSGLCLTVTPGIVDWSEIWPWTKLFGVLGMTGFHIWLVQQQQRFLSRTPLSGKTYRIMNEVPTLLMVVIVCSVIIRF